ncbi:MAG: AAA family ATPase [Myxococcales bacterium]|nr:AAA family ATPase [Myxococcales bacterium]
MNTGAAHHPRDRTGEVLGRYRVQRLLGVGGMGSVYLAEDAEQRRVALKVLNDSVLRDRSARMRFIREAQAAAAVVHPCVAAVFEINELDDAVFIAMEYVDGKTLRAALDEQAGPLPLQEALRIAREIALALSHAHAAGVIHRDLKPENLMLDARGVLKILDFGLAKQTGALTGHDASNAPTIFSTGEGVILGTPSYMAPEQIRGRPVDARADIFSLGVILYEMVTGARPFRGASAMEILISTARDELTPASSLSPRVPAGLDAALARALAKNPEDRTATADELAATLDALLVAELDAELAAGAEPDASPAARPRHEITLPHGLLGREPHAAALLAAVDRAARGEVLLVLLRGDTGLGKSTLLASLRDPVNHRGGRFAAGKFDHLARGAPLAPLAEALRAVARHIAAEPAGTRASWLKDLAEATGPNRHVLDDMVPELHGLLGPPPRASSADAGEAKNRFHAAFQRLVRLFAAGRPPLVLGLDDLHGADPSALQLLELLLTDPAGGHLLVVASCRDVGDDAHPLRVHLDGLRRLGATVVDVPVEPLASAEVARFVATSLGCELAEAAPLARVLDIDARGNPAVLRHLLLGLRREGQLKWSSQVGRWTWDIRTPTSRGADDVATFLAGKLLRLAPGVQRVLAIAACAARPIDLATLSAIDARGPVATARDLREALREGLLVTVDGELDPSSRRALYQPLHDGIHQAAYALLTPEDRAAIHLQVGRQLLQIGDDLFTAIDHFQRGAEAITDPLEREQLARLYLEAARRARGQTAYAAAVRHARAGIAALEQLSAPPGSAGLPDIWAARPELAFQLHRECMHADAMHGDLAAADAMFAVLVPRAPDPLERADLHRLKCQLDTYHGRTHEAIAAGLAGLGQLGIHLEPRPAADAVEADALALAAAFAAVADADLGDFDPGDFDDFDDDDDDVGAADTATNMRAAAFTATDPDLALGAGPNPGALEVLLARRETADPRVASTAELLAATAPAAMFADTRLAYRLYMQLVHLWLRHGPTRATAYGLAGYGLYLAGSRRDFAGAFVYGQLALRLRDRLPDPAQGARMLHIVGALIMGWTQPFTAAAATLERGYTVGVQTGDFAAATYNATSVILVLIAARRSVSHMRATAEQLLLAARPILEVYGSGIIRMAIRTARCLAGELLAPDDGPVERWAADVFDGELAHERTPLPLLYLHIYRSLVLYHFGRHDVPPMHPAAAERFNALLTPMAVDVFFYRVLHGCAAIAEARDPAAAHAALAADIAELASLADICPANFEARARIAAAEYDRVCGKLDAAESRFKVAIRAARKHGETGSEALAHELAGRLALTQGDDVVGHMHLRAAIAAYHRWGAPAVADRLAREHDLAEDETPA